MHSGMQQCIRLVIDPKMGPKLALPLKQGLDPKKYGGFSSQQFAYFFVYEARDKKDKQVFRFAEVPVWLASQIESDKTALERYATGLAEAEKLKFVRIERARILKKQLIEIDGDRLFITGLKEVRSGQQIALTQDEIKVLVCDRLDEHGVESLLRVVVGKAPACCERLAKQLSLDSIEENMGDISVQEKMELIKGLVSIVDGFTRTVNMTSVGGSANAGAMVMNRSRSLIQKQTS